MESPLLEANAIVDLNSRCVGLLNMSRHGLLLKDGGRTLDRKRFNSQKKTARRSEPSFNSTSI